MATINEVAAQAGVSVKTVSRMLSGNTGVRQQTRERIQQAMSDLNYHPSAAAQSLRGQGAQIVSLITDSLTTTPDSYEIVKGIQSVCEANDKLLMLGETGGSCSAFEKLIDSFMRQRVESVILATISHRAIEIDSKFQNYPIVLINCFDPDKRFVSVTPDDQKGANAIAEQLIRQGHQHIGFIGLLPDMVATQLRLAGYRDALTQNGMSIREELIKFGISNNPADEFRDLPQILDALLSQSPAPTALMCGNDKMALRMMMLLNAKGLRVPEDISVAGYDDYRLISENLIPKLTTAALPYFDMGVQGARIALGLQTKTPMVLDCPVVWRQSVATHSLNRA